MKVLCLIFPWKDTLLFHRDNKQLAYEFRDQKPEKRETILEDSIGGSDDQF